MKNTLDKLTEHNKELQDFKQSLHAPGKASKFTGLGKHQENVIKESVDMLWDIRSEIESDVGRISEETYQYYNDLIEKVESKLKELITL